MNNKTIITIAIGALMLSFSFSRAEIIRLKNGTVVHGTITSETKINIKFCDAKTGKEEYFMGDQIANIVSDKAIDGPIDTAKLAKLSANNWRNLEDKSKKISDAPQEAPKEAPGFTSRYKPRAGIALSYCMPSGDIGTALDPAIGFGALFDVRVPVFAETSALELRSGISAGYAKFTSPGSDSTLAAEVTILPIMLSNEFGYLTSVGFRPYAKFELGISMTSLADKSDNSEKKDTSSMDFTLRAGAGAGYRHKSLPSLEVFLEGAYMMVFEKVNGNFLQFTFGATYHFATQEESHANPALVPK